MPAHAAVLVSVPHVCAILLCGSGTPSTSRELSPQRPKLFGQPFHNATQVVHAPLVVHEHCHSRKARSALHISKVAVDNSSSHRCYHPANQRRRQQTCPKPRQGMTSSKAKPLVVSVLTSTM